MKRPKPAAFTMRFVCSNRGTVSIGRPSRASQKNADNEPMRANKQAAVQEQQFQKHTGAKVNKQSRRCKTGGRWTSAGLNIYTQPFRRHCENMTAASGGHEAKADVRIDYFMRNVCSSLYMISERFVVGISHFHRPAEMRSCCRSKMHFGAEGHVAGAACAAHQRVHDGLSVVQFSLHSSS
jgi:hypothetical protein